MKNKSLTVVRRGLLVIGVISILWFLFSIFFIDYLWWWFVLELAVLTLTILYLYKDQIWGNIKNITILRHVTGWLILGTTLFVVSAVFISQKWWSGLLIVIFELCLFFSFIDADRNPMDFIKNRKIGIIAGIAFTSLLCFYSIPSYLVAEFKNPRESFSNPNTYYDYAVDSYVLYGPMSDRDTEHVVPKDWFSSPEHFFNDFVNLVHSNKQANRARDNKFYGDVPKETRYEIKYEDIVTGYADENHFMPTDEYKGDVARITLYMYLTYKDDGLYLPKEYISLMKRWSRLDPVDDKEKARNNAINDQKGYSNTLVEMHFLIGFIVIDQYTLEDIYKMICSG